MYKCPEKKESFHDNDDDDENDRTKKKYIHENCVVTNLRGNENNKEFNDDANKFCR
jgi:hypothetical protein